MILGVWVSGWFVFVLMTISCQRKWDNPYGASDYNTPPQAVFMVTRLAADKCSLQCDASASLDKEDHSDELLVRWDWESDGVWDTDWSAVKQASHLFTGNGQAVVRCQVRDRQNGIDNAFKIIGIAFEADTWLNHFIGYVAVDAAPVAFAQGDRVRWDSTGDGTWDTGWDSVLTDTFVYPVEGEQTIRLEVCGVDGAVGVLSTRINVNFHPGMQPVPGNTFWMGSTYETDADNPNQGLGMYADEMPVHQVTVAAFWLDSTEVTQAEYAALLGVNPSFAVGRADNPVEQVTWFDAVMFCNARSRRDGLDTVYTYTGRTLDQNLNYQLTGVAYDLTRNGYRLPTEAEWECAARGNTATRYHCGDDTLVLEQYAWFRANALNRVHPVARKLPNQYGLYDMHGNVFEWCHDWYDPLYYSAGPAANPIGPASSPTLSRVTRGGCYLLPYSNNRSAQRSGHYDAAMVDYLGFRVALPTQ
jgi:formylglycine-generating enzyme required for sulfatase activity